MAPTDAPMPTKITDGAIALAWQDILDKLNLSEMPPEDARQPPKGELADFLEATVRRVAIDVATQNHEVVRLIDGIIVVAD